MIDNGHIINQSPGVGVLINHYRDNQLLS